MAGVVAQGKEVIAQKVAMFGGAEDDTPAPATVVQWDVALICPVVHELYTESCELAVSPGEQVIAVEELASDDNSASNWSSGEFLEWVTQSRAAGRDFARTMLTTSFGAVPIHFTVLKYLEPQKLAGGWFVASIATPVLLISASIFFILALRPAYALIDTATFADFRQRRLSIVARWMTAGMCFFLAAITLAVVIYAALLRER